MKILEVFSDYVCPWCYLGKRRLEEALDRFEGRASVQVVHRAFQLDPRRPMGETQNRRRMLMAKYGWTEQQVRDALRSSPEYRELTTITPAKAQEIVRRAYLAVLKREPDAGSQGYVNRVFHDHWTQADVEREKEIKDFLSAK